LTNRFGGLACAILLLCCGSAAAQRRLSLQEAISLGARSRSDYVQAQIDLERAGLGLLRARLERVHLTIALNASEQAQKLGEPITGSSSQIDQFCQGFPDACGNEKHTFLGQATLTVPVWSGFQIEADIARARWLEKVAKAQSAGTLRTIALDVARAYWSVRRVELLREVEAEAVRRDSEIEQVVGVRVRAGIAPQVDENRARVATLREKAQLAQLDGQLVEARAQLAAVLQIDDEIVLTEDPSAHAPLVPPLQLALDDARTGRPELLAASAQTEAQAEAVRSAKSGYWPQLTLFAHADVQNSNPFVAGLAQNDLSANFSVGGRVDWTLFDTLTTWAQVRDADYQRERYQADRARQGFLIDADVRGAHARLAKAIAQRAALTESERVARETLDVIRKRYQAGDALVIELVDAQVQLLRSESDLVDNAVTIAQADADLEAARGKL
jgi:outer membrane protein TolC